MNKMNVYINISKESSILIINRLEPKNIIKSITESKQVPITTPFSKVHKITAVNA